MSARITVVTPTYERADKLPRLYESLIAQDCRDFEWLVVDDGSSDGTAELVEGWREEGKLSIELVRQKNQGKHAALNHGFGVARGEFCAVMDDDDWYAPEALGRMLYHWDSIPAAERDGFASVEGLSADPQGVVIGDRYPADLIDSSTFEIGWVYGVTGDKLGMYRRDVLVRYPYPEDLGWHVTAAVVWNRIAAKYRSRFVNEIWGFKEYLDEGISDRETELRLRFPRASLVFWDELAAMPRPMPAKVRFRANANRIRYVLHCRDGLVPAVRNSPTPGWALIAIPAGVVLWARDRRTGFRAEPGAG